MLKMHNNLLRYAVLQVPLHKLTAQFYALQWSGFIATGLHQSHPCRLQTNMHTSLSHVHILIIYLLYLVRSPRSVVLYCKNKTPILCASRSSHAQLVLPPYEQCSQHTAHALNIQEHTIRLRSVPENHNADCSQLREVSYLYNHVQHYARLVSGQAGSAPALRDMIQCDTSKYDTCCYSF